MRGAQGVEIGFLHQFEVLPLQVARDGASQERMRIMMAGAADLHRLAIDEQLAAEHLGLAEADPLRHPVQHAALSP